MMTKAETLLRRVRLELARDHEFPNGSSERGYEFIAPLDSRGRIDLAAWKTLRDRCRVRRFWAHERDEVGHIVHKRGTWAFHYDIHGDPNHDETGFRLDAHTFVPSEYVSIKEQDGVLRTFRVVSVREID
ncbi:MAG: hypothetical protein K2X43_18500 [Hyphomonadaceae bacterium]|jgi:hypothetical protein|nr:hypothetical protein [Hyphomonadaceae bacterium]